MNDRYGDRYIPPRQYQSTKKKTDPRLKKIILAVIAVLLILGSIPRSCGTEGKGVWGRKAVLWETVSCYVPVVTENFVGYRDGSTFRSLILNGILTPTDRRGARRSSLTTDKRFACLHTGKEMK